MKILILKEFDVSATHECGHDPSAPPHPAYSIDDGGVIGDVCSLDAVARPDVLEAPAVNETDVPPGIVP